MYHSSTHTYYVRSPSHSPARPPCFKRVENPKPSETRAAHHVVGTSIDYNNIIILSSRARSHANTIYVTRIHTIYLYSVYTRTRRGPGIRNCNDSTNLPNPRAGYLFRIIIFIIIVVWGCRFTMTNSTITLYSCMPLSACYIIHIKACSRQYNNLNVVVRCTAPCRASCVQETNNYA